ncbi:MAG: hypothetical protein KBT36_13060, partial [Kurthia sp.]|nr:hypothetical protein [Candidatus Kurthia equi]
ISLQGESSIKSEGNIQISNTKSLEIDNSATLYSGSSLSIKSKKLTAYNQSSINAKERLDFFIQDSISFSNNNKIGDTALQTNIYYTGLSQVSFYNSFKNKLNFDSLYSGVKINNSASINGTIIVRDNVPSNNAGFNKDISFENDSGNIRGPFYIYAPYSSVLIKQSKISGSIIGKKVEIDLNASVTFQAQNPNTSPGSPGTEVTNEAGVITSTFSNTKNSGSIEID